MDLQGHQPNCIVSNVLLLVKRTINYFWNNKNNKNDHHDKKASPLKELIFTLMGQLHSKQDHQQEQNGQSTQIPSISQEG